LEEAFFSSAERGARFAGLRAGDLRLRLLRLDLDLLALDLALDLRLHALLDVVLVFLRLELVSGDL
jgi:hypothetical protein